MFSDGNRKAVVRLFPGKDITAMLTKQIKRQCSLPRFELFTGFKVLMKLELCRSARIDNLRRVFYSFILD